MASIIFVVQITAVLTTLILVLTCLLLAQPAAQPDEPQLFKGPSPSHRPLARRQTSSAPTNESKQPPLYGLRRWHVS
jgi:hypothetical protein